MYPENDEQFEETTIKSVKDAGEGWSIEREDGFSFFVSDEKTSIPKVGALARFYGKGTGFTVRGLFLDGKEVFYRTKEEDDEKREVDMYGADAQDWLSRWDAGKTVWTIEMGGMGPGYEQAIQITVAELLRHMVESSYDHKLWSDEDKAKSDSDAIDKASHEIEAIKILGLSGAQYGAAKQVASKLYMDGPRGVMTQEAVKDRHIQVSKNFPQAA